MSQFRILLLVLFFCTPMYTHAQIVFSEIAWMGSDSDADSEWIELFNHGTAPTSVEGWILTDGDDFEMTLHGAVLPFTIILLERDSDDTVPGVTAFQTYTGELEDSGGTLVLADALGAEIARVDGGTNWQSIGGSNTLPKKPPQQGQVGWVTGTPTPGAPNVAHDAPPEEDEEEEVVTIVKKSSGGGGSSKKLSEEKELVDSVLSLSVDGPRVAYVNQEIELEAIPDGMGRTVMNSLVYSWNFGDTYTSSGRTTTHIFEYPGEYVIVSGAKYAGYSAQARHEITVLATSFSLTRSSTGDIVLYNGADYEVDISDFVLTGDTSITFPEMTILKSHGVLTISKGRMGRPTSIVSLYDTENIRVASTDIAPRTQTSVTTSTLAKPKQVQTALAETIHEVSLVESQSEDSDIQKNEEVPKEGILKRFFSKIFSIFGR